MLWRILLLAYFWTWTLDSQVSYLSDAMESMHRCQGSYTPEERAQQQKRIKDMKAELTTTNFRLGDEVPSYVSVNRESMAIAERFRDVERVSMNTGLKEAVKKSSIHFGNERVVYETVAHEAMKYRGNENNFSKLKEEVQEMTTTLRRHNFTFGDEKVLYESDYQRGYGSISSDAYASMANRKKGMRAIIEDSRACHFSLGNDRPQYLSNTHAALKTIESHSATDVTAQIERAKAMKAALQKTSFIIGDDEEYF